MVALVTVQGTACAESGLCRAHDSTAERDRVKADADPDAMQWISGIENPDIRCVICGRTYDDEAAL